jgi:hypothetical protein
MPIPLRGLRTIRTLAGKVNQNVAPHRAHLQSACLEIEKTRRTTERTSVMRRAAEQARLSQAPAEHEEKTTAVAKPLSRGRAHPFRVRYEPAWEGEQCAQP